jgi:hypothetical protein
VLLIPNLHRGVLEVFPTDWRWCSSAVTFYGLVLGCGWATGNCPMAFECLLGRKDGQTFRYDKKTVVFCSHTIAGSGCALSIYRASAKFIKVKSMLHPAFSIIDNVPQVSV